MAELLAQIEALSREDKIALMQAILELLKHDNEDQVALERAQLVYAQSIAEDASTKWLGQNEFWAQVEKRTGFKNEGK